MEVLDFFYGPIIHVEILALKSNSTFEYFVDLKGDSFNSEQTKGTWNKKDQCLYPATDRQDTIVFIQERKRLYLLSW